MLFCKCFENAVFLNENNNQIYYKYISLERTTKALVIFELFSNIDLLLLKIYFEDR